MSIFLAKNAFRRQRRFLKHLLANEAPKDLKVDQARALLCFLHHLVNGRIPIRNETFEIIRRNYGLQKLRREIESRSRFGALMSLLKSDLKKVNNYLYKFRFLWKHVLGALFEKPKT